MKRNLLAPVLILALLSATAQAQAPAPAPAPAYSTVAASRYHDGMRLQARGDERGAFLAFLEAAEGGFPPAQRRLGEIYDNGSVAVERNYPESIRWYQKARDAGEPIPSQKPRMQGIVDGK